MPAVTELRPSRMSSITPLPPVAMSSANPGGMQIAIEAAEDVIISGTWLGLSSVASRTKMPEASIRRMSSVLSRDRLPSYTT